MYTTVCDSLQLNQTLLFLGYLGKIYDEITVNMIIAVTQAIGFSNSFNNPIVYAFMNENFQKNCMSTISLCIRRSGHRVDVNDKSNVRFSKTPRQEEDIFVMPRIHIVDQVASARSNTQESLSILEERISAEDSTIHARCIRD